VLRRGNLSRPQWCYHQHQKPMISNFLVGQSVFSTMTINIGEDENYYKHLSRAWLMCLKDSRSLREIS
jgi:hypothetical protein